MVMLNLFLYSVIGILCSVFVCDLHFFINNVKTSVRPKSYLFFIKTFENYTLGLSSPHSLQLNHSPANLASSSASVSRAVTELEPLEVLRVPSHVRKETIFVRSF